MSKEKKEVMTNLNLAISVQDKKDLKYMAIEEDVTSTAIIQRGYKKEIKNWKSKNK